MGETAVLWPCFRCVGGGYWKLEPGSVAFNVPLSESRATERTVWRSLKVEDGGQLDDVFGVEYHQIHCDRHDSAQISWHFDERGNGRKDQRVAQRDGATDCRRAQFGADQGSHGYF